jgi:hypothetical protein
LIHDLTIRQACGEFTPIDLQGIFAIAQRHLIDEAIRIDMMSFAGPSFFHHGFNGLQVNVYKTTALMERSPT